MKEEVRDLLILKYIQGGCTPEEQAELEQWLQANPQNQEHFAQMQVLDQHLNQLDLQVDADTDGEWKKLRRTIGAEAQIRRLPWRRALRVAAAIAALVTVSWLVSQWILSPTSGPVAQEYVTDKGVVKTFTLPDGSSIQLNADSKLTLAADFNQKERRLNLEGEAYFKVAKDAERPFIVETGNIYTQVLGTAFNVSAYPESARVEVAVAEGIVQFLSPSTSGLRLETNMAGQYRKVDRVFASLPYDGDRSLAWLNGGLVFRDTPLAEVIQTLERKYNVVIRDQTNDPGLIYSDEVSQEDTIFEVVSRLAMALGIQYQLQDNSITLLPK